MTGDPPAPRTAIAPWFPVATHKFIVLSIFSFGIYDFYWVYQNWQRAQRATGEGFSPFWRTFLIVPVWAFSLLRRIRQSADAAGVPARWNADVLAFAFIVLAFAPLLPNIGFFLSLISCTPLIPPVRAIAAINAAAGDPEGVNDRYTLPCVATIVLGGFVYLILIIATALGY
jgi:hypothetical protein